jgi:transposase
MFDTNEETRRSRGRAEFRSGVVRRRCWTAEEKGRVVAQAVSPGAVVAEVARQYDLIPHQLSN